MRWAIACLFVCSLLRAVPGAGAAHGATPGATPAMPDLGITLPTEADLPAGMTMIMDGSRTLDDVLANFPDKAGAESQFAEWGWRANVVRAFHLPAGAETSSGEVDGLYISVHQFGGVTAAMDALDYIFAVHARDSGLHLRYVDGLGDYARELYGEMPYGNEVTWYVQVDDLVIRFSASSPEGDPRPEAEPLLRAMLATHAG